MSSDNLAGLQTAISPHTAHLPTLQGNLIISPAIASNFAKFLALTKSAGTMLALQQMGRIEDAPHPFYPKPRELFL